MSVAQGDKTKCLSLRVTKQNVAQGDKTKWNSSKIVCNVLSD